MKQEISFLSHLSSNELTLDELLAPHGAIFILGC